MRFVLVKHPTRGTIILMSTGLHFQALMIIKIHGLRFKIEVSFKQAVHTLGSYAYHFWMKPMKKISRFAGNQNLIGKTARYREAAQRKLGAYHRYVLIGCIAQGLLQHLAINFRVEVWATFRSWLRTMKPDLAPSEMVVANALQSSLPEFLQDRKIVPDIKKFFLDRVDHDRISGFSMIG